MPLVQIIVWGGVRRAGDTTEKGGISAPSRSIVESCQPMGLLYEDMYGICKERDLVYTSKTLNRYRAPLPALQHRYPLKGLRKAHLASSHSWCRCSTGTWSGSGDQLLRPDRRPSALQIPGNAQDWPLTSCYSNLGSGTSLEVLFSVLWLILVGFQLGNQMYYITYLWYILALYPHCTRVSQELYEILKCSRNLQFFSIL